MKLYTYLLPSPLDLTGTIKTLVLAFDNHPTHLQQTATQVLPYYGQLTYKRWSGARGAINWQVHKGGFTEVVWLWYYQLLYYQVQA